MGTEGSARQLPEGTVTFLFTDIEGSTRLLQELGDRYSDVLQDQRRLMREAIASNRGLELGTEGDSFFVVFVRATDAVQAVVSAQQALAAHTWPEGHPVRVRMGLHTGEARAVGGDYIGLDVHRAARIAASGHGGQVVISDTVLALVEKALPTGVTVRDLGEHRLKDLPRPEHLYQVDIDGFQTDFPPLKSLEIRKNNVPLQLTSFLGRDKEIAELKDLLLGTRLLTLAGTGGIGKTRLAIQLATEVLESYGNGVWLLELAPITDPDLVPRALMTVLDVHEQAGRTAIDSLIDYLRPKDILLLLDNCEHLVEPCAQLAETLLQACPRVRIVATSREGLGVAGETVWRVPTLGMPDADRLPSFERVAESAAVALFADRAMAASPTFRLTEANAVQVVQVCQRLDGIPLAIELAASRLSILTLPQLVTRLNDRFKVLTGGRRTSLPRQQTLRATIDWSYELLGEPERVLLRRVFVFAGGFSLELAEEVCAWDPLDAADLIDLLSALVAKSLVAVDEQPGGFRYHQLETIRDYAAERARTAGEEVEVQARHRSRFLAYALEAEDNIHGPDQLAWFDRIDVEMANLRAAFEGCLIAQEVESALRIAAALGLYWRARGRFTEGRDWLERALASKAAAPATLRAKALAWASYLAIYQGAYAQAQISGEESLNLYTAAGDAWGTGFALQTLGAVALNQDDYAYAIRLEQESLHHLRQTKDTAAVGLSYLYLGVAALRKGEYASAIGMLEQALVSFRDAGDQRRVSIALRLMGEVELCQGHYTPATTLLGESLELVRQAKDRVDVGLTLYLLGQAARAAADYTRATELFEESLALAREFNDTLSAGLALCELAIVARHEGNLNKATSLVRDSLAVLDHREKFGIAACLQEMAMILTDRGATEKATVLFAVAHRIRDELGAPLPPFELDEYQVALQRVQASLDDEEFKRLTAEGQAMAISDAIALPDVRFADGSPDGPREHVTLSRLST